MRIIAAMMLAILSVLIATILAPRSWGGWNSFVSYYGVAVGLGVGFGLYKLIRGSGQVNSVFDHGKRWFAVLIGINTAAHLPRSLVLFDSLSLAKLLYLSVVGGGLAFVLGCLYGFVKRKRDSVKRDREGD